MTEITITAQNIAQAIEELLDQKKELENRIKKAIDFIGEFEYYIPEDDVPELLDILRGSRGIKI